MTVLIDLQHPAHLHVFRNLVRLLRAGGHRVILTGRDKDILVGLADRLGFEVDFFGRARPGVLHLGGEWLYRMARLHRIIRRQRPDLVLAVAGTFVALPARLHRVPALIFYDTEHATASNLLAYPFSSCIYVPRCYRKPIRWRHVRYNGYHELAYLHPAYFSPDDRVLAELGLKPGERFTVARFVSWTSGHDIGRTGLTRANKIAAVRRLEAYGRVFVSSESELPPELEPNRLRLDVGRIHHLLAHAALLFGESATMASEAAVLGVPSIFIDPIGRGYTDEQQREYGIVFHFKPDRQQEAISQAESLLAAWPQERESWRATGRRIVAEKADLTALMMGLVRERAPAARQTPGA